MSLISVLKWVVTGENLWKDENTFTDQSLINILKKHYITGRFSKRCKQSNKKFFSEYVINQVEEYNKITDQFVNKNIDAVLSLQEELPSDSNIIVIKGFAVFLLTYDQYIMHIGDIDLLCKNNTIEHIMLNQGYIMTKPMFLHELGEFTKSEVEIDWHEYFPVYYYTSKLINANLNPNAQPTLWVQSYTMEKMKITYDIMQQHACEINIKERSIFVPDANLLCIILCAHAFMNYTNLWSISHRDKAYIRLGELADIKDLLLHKSFDCNQFNILAKDLGALDAVLWVINIIHLIFHKKVLPIDVEYLFNNETFFKRFPRCIWWDFWINVPESIDHLLGDNWFEIETIVNHLQYNSILLDKESILYSMSDFYRLLQQKKEALAVTIQFTRNEKALHIHIYVQSNYSHIAERIRIDLGNICSEWIFDLTNNTKKLVGTELQYIFFRNKTGYDVEFIIPDIYIESKSFYALIGVGKQLNEFHMENSVLIPLKFETTK